MRSFPMKIMRPLGLAALCLAMSAVSACGGHAGGTAAGGSGTSRTQAYDKDGYLGLTSANPNLPTSPSYHTYAVDVEMIRRAALSVNGVRDLQVALGNATANVRLIADESLSPQDLERIQREALEAITYNMPRYTVRVTVDRDDPAWLQRFRGESRLMPVEASVGELERRTR